MNSRELARNAAFHSDLVPVPDYVLNDAVRNTELTSAMEFFDFSSGDYENLVLSGVQLREREMNIKTDFHNWLDQKDYTIPDAFKDDNEDVRFYMASGRTFQGAYDAMLLNEKWLLESQILLMARYVDFKPYLDAGVIYGYNRDKQSRPVMFFNVKKSLDMNMDID